MRRANASMELWPWAGLVGAALGWALDHQVGGDGIFYHCGRRLPVLRPRSSACFACS